MVWVQIWTDRKAEDHQHIELIIPRETSLASGLRSCQSPSVCMHAKSFQSCLTLCDFMECSPPGSSALGILQAGILEWVALPSSRGSSLPRDWTHISYLSSLACGFFTPSTTPRPDANPYFFFLTMLTLTVSTSAFFKKIIEILLIYNVVFISGIK